MFALTAPAAEDTVSLELGVPFVDHVVLQQGIRLPVWGTAPAGAEVTVEFAGQTHTAKAGDDNAWRVFLDPLVADKLASVSVTGLDTHHSNTASVTIHNSCNGCPLL